MSKITEIEAFALVYAELSKANEKFPPFNSAHEGYAVILEEVDELWHEIKNDKQALSKIRQTEEAIQIAAMAIKFITSCGVKNL